jgi:DNA-binding PucR family transcriptional regulator
MEHVRLMVSLPIATPLLLEKAFRQLLTLSHALTQFRPRVMVAGIWHYPLEQWATTLPTETSKQLARSIQSEITAHPLTEEQIETLETLFRCQLNISDTSRQLYLHRNTLLYRLDKLTEQTGLDPRQFSHAVLLKLFLLFRQN